VKAFHVMMKAAKGASTYYEATTRQSKKEGEEESFHTKNAESIFMPLSSINREILGPKFLGLPACQSHLFLFKMVFKELQT
jgi:hypothetical protein